MQNSGRSQASENEDSVRDDVEEDPATCDCRIDRQIATKN